MRTSAAPARPATTSIGRRCTTEPRDPAGLGPANPAGSLAARRSDRLQLVVGAQPPHRLAHLVGVRDPDLADLPLALGLGRQLDGAFRKLRAGSSRDRRL